MKLYLLIKVEVESLENQIESLQIEIQTLKSKVSNDKSKEELINLKQNFSAINSKMRIVVDENSKLRGKLDKLENDIDKKYKENFHEIYLLSKQILHSLPNQYDDEKKHDDTIQPHLAVKNPQLHVIKNALSFAYQRIISLKQSNSILMDENTSLEKVLEISKVHIKSLMIHTNQLNQDKLKEANKWFFQRIPDLLSNK